MTNLLRIAVIFFGGGVVGAGFVILRERARHYGRLNLATAQRAMWALAVVNALTLTFIALTLIARWDLPLTWRWPCAIAVFAAKALFFHWLRQTGLEQERREVYGEPA